ncbi:hypothetical protein P9279_22185 [Mesorhizobium sp. WSM4962]|uniref:hypothetical protein n=1 Tax=Mesorhizobium sp. WSM4962 TaxID=3038548 RepID=UPI002415B4DD|nr:hypothetical protein [Mesorhizobium sp. WSM4962]MDG4903223.1 hypothetical protein [Mesorhizobium sp. WSM4962]
MAPTYRRVKGSNLTPDEVDDNFEGLDERLTEVENNPPAAVGISNITVVGTQMTIYLADATVLGPYTLPQANFRPSVVAEISAATHTPALGDANSYKRCTNAGGCVVTVPLNADVPFPIDTELGYLQADDGPVTFEVSTDGPTLNPVPSFLAQTAQQGALVTLKKVGEDEWDIGGWLAADVTA